jgi:hypothetical protein
MVNSIPKCRNCGALLTRTLVDLGLSPLANSYTAMDSDAAREKFYPLHARVCDDCLLVQVDDVVPADEIFSADYAYFSSYSATWLAHCEAYARMAQKRFNLGSKTLVTEIASNDGYLLQYFVAMGIPVLGIDPTANTAAVAESRGVPTLVKFFSAELARQLASEGYQPRLVCSANVLAHVPDIKDFVAGIAALLKGDAVYTVEFPHLLNLIKEIQFDTIYHEHYSYLSLLAVERVFAAHGLRVFDVESLSTHGGSLRVYACLDKAAYSAEPGVALIRAREKEARLDRPEGYSGFEAKVRSVREDLLAFLARTRREGKIVAAYGAAAKGNTLLNYCGIGPDLIPFVVDKNPAKQGKRLPGSRIPVMKVDKLRQHKPDYILILPWNLKAEIVEQLDDLRRAGTAFVTAIPKVSFVE